jgi:hypothetical protein
MTYPPSNSPYGSDPQGYPGQSPYGQPDPYGGGPYSQPQQGQPQYGQQPPYSAPPASPAYGQQPPYSAPPSYGQYPQDSYGQYPGAAGYPPPPPRKSRTGLIVGLALGAVVLVALVVGAIVVLPGLTGSGGDPKTAAGAKAAAQHAVDSIRSGDYGAYYDMLDTYGQGGISRSEFVRQAKCENLAGLLSKVTFTVGDATVTGDEATVKITVVGESSGSPMQLRYENNHWRIHDKASGVGASDKCK